MRRAHSCCGLVASLALLLSSAVVAQDESAIAEGWHVVRPGETLWSLAERYLGSDENWPVLHALNPEIEDPHWIAPGDRVRVRVEGVTSLEMAQISKVSRRVEEQLSPHPWVPSNEEDLLNPRDGVRTFEASSSELLFPDATRLVISEDSLVFLGHGGRVEREVRRDEIEIVVGQADYGAGSEAEARSLILGGSRVQPAAASGERSSARVRKPETGAVEVMIFEGQGAVESGGASQVVEAGMGTLVEEGEPPSPPEALLVAAEIESPAAQSEWYVADLAFSWKPVDGAKSYVLEVCGDPHCGLLETRQTGLDATASNVSVSLGLHYWRVTAVSESGLDGFPSEPAAFTVVSTSADTEGPTVAWRVSGPNVERRGKTYLGVGARVEIDVEDSASGVESWEVMLDGTPVEPEVAQEVWEKGSHKLVVVARDRAGNEATSEPFRFIYDPQPPRIRIGFEIGRVFHNFRGEVEPVEGPAGRRRFSADLTWSLTDESWQPVGEGEWTLGKTFGFSLRSSGKRTRIYPQKGAALRLKPGRGARVLTIDKLSGPGEVVFRVDRTDEVEPRLIVEAVDRLGNRSSVSWPLSKGRRWGSN